MTKRRKINYFIPLAIIAGIGLAIYTSNKPFKVYQQEKAKADEMRADLNSYQQSNAKLREKDQIMSPVQKEEEARRMGYVRPDEKSVPGRDNTLETPSTQSLAPKPKKAEAANPPIDLRDSDKNDEVQAAPE
ncbi:MAG: hypothetical protein WCI55_00045 [Armatimonadota bacterium]